MSPPCQPDGCSAEQPELAPARRSLGHNDATCLGWRALTSPFAPIWDILNPRIAAAQGFLAPYFHSDPRPSVPFPTVRCEGIELHQWVSDLDGDQVVAR